MSSESYMNKPRKVIVATGMFPHYGAYPGLHKRLDQISEFIDAMQEQIDQNGWVRGNSMVFLISGSGLREAYSWENSPENAASLHIEYVQ